MPTLWPRLTIDCKVNMRMRRRRWGPHEESLLSAVALAISAAAATIACADPRLDEKVYTPYIQNGVAEFEVRTAGEVGGAERGTSTTVLEAEYGVNDRLSLALVTGLEQAPHEAGRFTSVGLEGVFYVGRGSGRPASMWAAYPRIQARAGRRGRRPGRQAVARQDCRPLSGPGESHRRATAVRARGVRRSPPMATRRRRPSANLGARCASARGLRRTWVTTTASLVHARRVPRTATPLGGPPGGLARRDRH